MGMKVGTAAHSPYSSFLRYKEERVPALGEVRFYWAGEGYMSKHRVRQGDFKGEGGMLINERVWKELV